MEGDGSYKRSSGSVNNLEIAGIIKGSPAGSPHSYRLQASFIWRYRKGPGRILANPPVLGGTNASHWHHSNRLSLQSPVSWRSTHTSDFTPKHYPQPFPPHNSSMPASKRSITGEYATSKSWVEEGQSQCEHPCHPCMTIEIGGVGRLHRNVTIGTLPDEVLLEIFSFYMAKSRSMEGWITLVHVCQRWRNVIFASPHHLNLRLLCEDRKPVRELLNIWPALPIVICDSEHIDVVFNNSRG
jgi:hypothetical protein